MSHQETQSFLFTWPADGASATVTIPQEMSSAVYTVTGDIEDVPVGGSAAILTFPSAGRTSTTFTIVASGSLDEDTTIALTVTGALLVAATPGEITWLDVTAVAADLASVPVAAQTDILDHVNTTLQVDLFGGEESPKLRLARIYLAAHHGTVAVRSDTAGPVQSESEEGVSVTYGGGVSIVGSDPLLDSTRWGQAFRQLCRTGAPRAPIVL